MTLDQHARARAAAVRSQLVTVAVPEPRAVVRAATRRRRTTAIAAAMVLVLAVLASFAIARSDRSSTNRVEVAGRGDDHLPAGAVVEGTSTMIPKGSAGLGSGASLHATASDGTSLLAAGTTSASSPMTAIWRSEDGLHCVEAGHPRSTGAITAINVHGQDALAVSAPGEAGPFVWRSRDRGRHWTQVASGDLFGAPSRTTGPVRS